MITEIRHATVSPVVKSYNCFFFTFTWKLYSKMAFVPYHIYAHTNIHTHAHTLTRTPIGDFELFV